MHLSIILFDLKRQGSTLDVNGAIITTLPGREELILTSWLLVADLPQDRLDEYEGRLRVGSDAD